MTDTISDKIEDLKKGRSDVLETNHTLILGWSDKVRFLSCTPALVCDGAAAHEPAMPCMFCFQHRSMLVRNLLSFTPCCS